MVSERPRKKRRHMLAETRLLFEWVAEHYRGRIWHHQLPVGRDPELAGITLVDEAERRLARRLNRRVDMLIPPPPDLVVIEATMDKPVPSVSQLEGYLLLLPATPEYREWKDAPLVPILLTAQDDGVARTLAERAGVVYEWWAPPWIDEFYAAYPDRRRRTPHAGMVAELARLPQRQRPPLAG